MSMLGNILKLRETSENNISELPALIMLAQEMCENVVHGAHAQRKSGMGEKFWQFREYESSDRPQDIDWRQSAKGDDVLVRQKEWHSTQKSYLWCAGGKSMAFRSSKSVLSKQDCAMVITLSLALLLRRGEEQIGIYGNLNTGRSEERIEKIGHYLLNRETQGDALPDTQGFSLPLNSSFFACGDFLTEKDDIQSHLVTLSERTKNGIVVQVLDPAELDLSYSGRVRFTGVSADYNTTIDHVASVREQYKKRMNAHTDFIKSLCHDYGWHYILHRTDTDIADTLRDIQATYDNEGSAP
jgi:uncharacterized protein (DUF58 family)